MVTGGTVAASIVVVFAVLTIGLGALGVATPGRLVALLARVQTPAGLVAATALRLVAGVALWLAAGASRAPLYFQIFGSLAIVAALSVPFIGLRRLEALLRWFTGRPQGLVRAWAVLALAIGASFLWALAP